MTQPRRQPRNKIIFVLGGASSGKSGLALTLCGAGKPRAFVATGQPLDEEMADRITRHQQSRRGQWETVEVPLDLAAWFHDSGWTYKNVVLDCLTLWLSNLQENGVSSQDIPSLVDELMMAVRLVPGRVVLVSNELGLGLVPADPISRWFRAQAGTMNQQVAQAADEVYLAVSGLPLQLK